MAQAANQARSLRCFKKARPSRRNLRVGPDFFRALRSNLFSGLGKRTLSLR